VFLTELPAFWIAAALILHYGLVALLLFTHPGSEPGEWMEDEGYAWVYTVVNLLRFILFSAAILSGISSEEEVRREAKA
jgi:hypothetical protein